jgi:predicted ATP-dependent serine protease
MATLVQILGEPGTGKTYSMRNLNPSETLYINADRKNMPFRGWKAKYSMENKNYIATSDIGTIYSLLKKVHESQPQIKVVVIDTINSIMSDKEMSERKKKG